MKCVLQYSQATGGILGGPRNYASPKIATRVFLLRNRPTTGGNVGRLTSGDTPTTHHAWLFALICRRPEVPMG